MPHIGYLHCAGCPWLSCDFQMRWVDFQVELGPGDYQQLVLSFNFGSGFAGRCPRCERWVGFTSQGKEALTDAMVEGWMLLPPDWAGRAFVDNEL